jgi:hypothetical protein
VIRPAGSPKDGQSVALGLPRLRGYNAAANTGGMMHSSGQLPGLGRSQARGVGVVLALSLLAGCSAYGSLTGSGPATTASVPSPAAPPSSSSSFSQRFSNFVLGAPETTAQAGVTAPSDIDCPGVEVRQGASTFQQNGADNGSTALSLRYQANFLKFARECVVRSGNVVMKVGVEGRVILGPAGTTGTLSLPVRLAVVKEGLDPKTVWTKFYMVPVVMPPGQPNVLFTHVEEDMSFPNPPGDDLDKYVVYVGFDPDSAAAEQKKSRPAPKKPKR